MRPKRYIRGKYAQAACALIDRLKAAGIAAVAVGYESGHRGRRLIAYVNSADDIGKVPDRFGDFSVTAIVAPGGPQS